MDGTSLISSDDGVNGVNFLLLCGVNLADKREESGLGGTVEDGVGTGVFIALCTVLRAGVGIANPSLSIDGVSCLVSSFVSKLGVVANGE